MVRVVGGDALIAATDKIASNLKKASSVEVGFLEGATYPDGTSVPMVAAIQEYGAPRAGIPPRPFFRSMIAAKLPEWGPAIAALLPKNEYNTQKTLAQTGEAIRGQLRQSIADLTAPPLSPVTLMLRKMQHEDPSLVVTGATVGEAARRVAAGEGTGGVSTKPLVWTGHLMASADYRVK